MGVTLIDSVYLDVRDSLLTESKLNGIARGSYKGGYGPSSTTLMERNVARGVKHGGRLGRDILMLEYQPTLIPFLHHLSRIQEKCWKPENW